MTAITRFREDIMVRLRGVSAELVDSEIRRACQMWCEATRAYRATLPAIDLVAGTAAYAPVAPSLVAPDDQRVCGVHTVRLASESTPLKQGTEDELDTWAPGWRDGTFDGAQSYYWLDGSTINLVPAPKSNVTGGLIVNVVLSPTNTAENVADLLYTTQVNRATIEFKVLASLYGMTGKPWSNANESMANEMRWLDGVEIADINVTRGHSRHPLRTRPS